MDQESGIWEAADGGNRCFLTNYHELQFLQPNQVFTSGVDQGVDRAGVRDDGGDHFSLSGRDVSFERIKASLGDPTLQDDSKALRLTVIGSDSARKPVEYDLKNNFKLMGLTQTDVIVKGVTPDHWSVKGSGFVTGGSPTIYLQSPTGKVLHRQDDYQGGADRLATAIRRAKPDYDPAKDPDLTKPVPPPQPAPNPNSPSPLNLPKVPVNLLVVLGLVGFVSYQLYTRKAA